MNERNIPAAVISRLPRYYRYIEELRASGVERVSSSQLSELMHVTASQIRQDFNHFGGFGQQGYGYNVKFLHDEMCHILGLDKTHNMIIIGSGNLGKAIANYGNFKSRGFNILGLFDIDESLKGSMCSGAPVYMMDELEDFIKNNKVDIVVIAIPKQEAIKLVEPIVKANIKAVWNFSHTDLPFPDTVAVENVHLSESLMVLSYKMGEND